MAGWVRYRRKDFTSFRFQVLWTTGDRTTTPWPNARCATITLAAQLEYVFFLITNNIPQHRGRERSFQQSGFHERSGLKHRLVDSCNYHRASPFICLSLFLYMQHPLVGALHTAYDFELLPDKMAEDSAHDAQTVFQVPSAFETVIDTCRLCLPNSGAVSRLTLPGTPFP